MKKEKISGIYLIRNKVNGKCYVGQSIDIKDRWKSHKTRAFNVKSEFYESYSVYVSMREYGLENFEFIILEESNDKLEELENKYIIKYNSIDNGYNSLLNNLEKKEMKKFNIELLEKKYNIDKEILLDLLYTYSFKEIGKKYGVSDNTIRIWCNSCNISTYAKDYMTEEKRKKYAKKMSILGKENSTCTKKVLQYSKDGKILIKEFNSLAEAAEELDVAYSNISRAIHQYEGRKTAFGFQWKFKD